MGHWLVLKSGMRRTLVVLAVLAPAVVHATPGNPELRTHLAGLRLPFVANEGQVDARVAYYAPTFAGTLFVTARGELVYALPGPTSRAQRETMRSPLPDGWTLTEMLRGGRPKPVGGDRSATGISYFLGDDPARWRPEVPTYEHISLGEVWPGVTVSLRAHGRSIEKVFTVHPGASVKRIRIRVGGAEALSVDARGALVARTGLGRVTFTAPVAYQERDGVRHPVAVTYRRQGREYGFRVGAYDHALPLVIDPLLQSTYLGGGGPDFGHALAIHPTTGDVYLAGDTGSSDFPGTTGGAQPTMVGNGNAFVARLSGSLTALRQATYLGGIFGAGALALAIHPTTGDVYVAGITSGNFPGTTGGAQSTYAGNQDGFVARLSSSLTTLVQSTYFGGFSVEYAWAVAIAPTTGDVYIAGDTFSTDLPGTTGGAQSTNAGHDDGFVARFSSSLTTLIQATYLGGSGFERVWALAIAPTTGDVYVAGETTSVDLPGRTGGAQSTYAGNVDAFVARLSSSLTTLTQSSYLGGSAVDVGRAITIAPATGDVYVAGVTGSTDFPSTSGGAQPTFGGATDGFVARLSSSLTVLTQATYLGGSADDSVNALTIAPRTGEVYVAGSTDSNNFPGTGGGIQPSLGGPSGYYDGFLVRLTSQLTAVIRATYLGGTRNDQALALVIALSTGDVYVAGYTDSLDFPGTSGGAQSTYGGGNFDAFVSRLTFSLAPLDTVAAVLPLSRSVQVGGAPATAFAAIINPGGATTLNCAPAPPSSPPAGLGTFTYQTTNAANQLIGAPNTPANIAPGATQNFVFGFFPTAAIAETTLAMRFVCDNAEAPQYPGVNNFFLVADTSPVPDTIALMSTVSGDGVVRIPAGSNLQLFAIGTSNVGATGTIVVSADDGGAGLPLTLTVCETTGGSTCLAPPTPTVTVNYMGGTNRSFQFFAQATGSIPFDPANTRVFARLRQSGVQRGATSTAVCTSQNPAC